MAQFGYRVMKAEWVAGYEGTFVAEILITGVDSGPGVIERLVNQVSSNLGLNIRKLSIEGHEGVFEGTLQLLVRNTDQLTLAIKELQNLDSVSTVTRIS
jgi:GTP pyrophosphokinase